jgi:PhnB protein
MKEVVAYLSFDGNTREAMTFYAQCLGAELELISFSDHMGASLPKEMEASKNRIMHARLSKASKSLLMASDAMPGMPLQASNNFSISIHCESVEEIDKLFAALSAGGTIRMPIAETSWGARFGMFTDRFGIPWMLNFELPKKG